MNDRPMDSSAETSRAESSRKGLHTIRLTLRVGWQTMSTQIAIRLDDLELAALDVEVAEGRAANRSDAVRRGIARMQRDRHHRGEEAC